MGSLECREWDRLAQCQPFSRPSTKGAGQPTYRGIPQNTPFKLKGRPAAQFNRHLAVAGLGVHLVKRIQRHERMRIGRASPHL